MEAKNGNLVFLEPVSANTSSTFIANGGISFLSPLTSPKITAKSLTGRIEGTYSASNVLNLEAEIGGIEAALYVTNSTSPTSISSSEVSVNAISRIGPVSLKYLDQSPGVKLFSHASSILGSVTVTHSSNFKGYWRLQTSKGSSAIKKNYWSNIFGWKVDRWISHDGQGGEKEMVSCVDIFRVWILVQLPFYHPFLTLSPISPFTLSFSI